jgi:hypothetical protein
MMVFLRIVHLKNNSQFDDPWRGTLKANSNVKERESRVRSETALGRYTRTEGDCKSE